jgi:CheY-like chemotaxis protein
MNDKPVILHVEDDPNDVLLVDLAFRKAGLPVSLIVVHDGDQAIDYLSGQGAYWDRSVHPLPAVVLLDLKLPRRSGLEVLAWLRGREDLRRMLVVMLTSSNQPTDVNRAYDLGANSYLVKPSALEQLINMLRQFSIYWLETNVRPLLQVDELAPG